MLEDFKYAFGCISWYNGYDEWLLALADELEKTENKYEYYLCPLSTEEWHTDKHALWMLLVGMFGGWGTSIRDGWIEKTKEAAAFIREVLEDSDAEN